MFEKLSRLLTYLLLVYLSIEILTVCEYMHMYVYIFDLEGVTDFRLFSFFFLSNFEQLKDLLGFILIYLKTFNNKCKGTSLFLYF